MAKLSDADKKQFARRELSGSQRLAELSNTKSAQQRVLEARRDNYEHVRNYALITAGIAAIIVVTNYLQMSGPYQPLLGMATEAAAVAAAICTSVAQIAIHRNR